MSHYTIHSENNEEGNGMRILHKYFDNGVDEMNVVLFSTSGVHGSYCTIEDIEKEPTIDGYQRDLTYLILQPRLVSMTYGLCTPISKEDFEFLKHIRQQSWKHLNNIGRSNINHARLGI